MDDFPAPIMPTRTTDRGPSAATIAASHESGTLPGRAAAGARPGAGPG